MFDRFPRTGDTFRLLYDSAIAFVDDRALRLGAGVAYYSLFALVPVLYLSLAVATLFLGEAVKGDVEARVGEVLGPEPAAALMSAIEAVEVGGTGIVASVAGLVALLLAGAFLFVAFKEVVDLMWGIPRERGVKASMGRRLFGLTAVLGAGVLLTVNLAIGTFIGFLNGFLDLALFDALLTIAGSFAAVALGAFFLAILFRHTPNQKISWRSVWFAAIVTMSLLTVGSWAYGVYLDSFGFSSAAGVAGAAFLGLVLVYYGTGIVLYGMEIVRQAHESDRFVPLSFTRWTPVDRDIL